MPVSDIVALFSLAVSASIIVSYSAPLKFSLSFSMFLCVLCAAFLPAPLTFVFFMFAALALIPFMGNFLRTVLFRERQDMEHRLKSLREEHARLLDGYSALKDGNRLLNRTAAEMEHLYEITRKMSEALEFDDIFKTFNDFLNRSMNFRECRLLLTGSENDTLFIEKAYKMKHLSLAEEASIEVGNPELKDEIALDVFHEDQRPVFLSSPKDDNRLKSFYTKQDIKTLASNPLFVEDELIGILVLEDLPEKDFEKFLIMAGQFALEIKKVKLYETIQKLAIIDGLTGVFVRRHFLERAEEEIKRSEHRKLAVSFLMIDIDHFKICNDRYGHLVGDVVLEELAVILKNNVREIDIVCRYGGEEFAIALPDTDRESALVVARRIRKTVEEFTFLAFDEKPQMTVSIGVSSYPSDGSDVHKLIDAADAALYEAKRTGRNKVCVWRNMPA